MSFFNTIFSSKKGHSEEHLILVDMHSHVLPLLDDGSESFEDSILLLKEFQAMGYKKLIATPHIMGDFFKNTPEGISAKCSALKELMKENSIPLELEFAAEYYLDEWFMERLHKNEKLLTFGDNYLLFELSYINPSAYFTEAVFLMKSQGYKPVLAHPERYIYWHGNTKIMQELFDKGIILQVNINSLIGYYSKGAKKMAEQLITMGLVKMLGSDCHGIRHIDAMKGARKLSIYKKALSSLLNNSLLA